MSTANEVENQLLRSSVDLAGKTVHLPQGSHEVKLLEHLSDQIGDTIYIVECDSLNSFDLVKAVETGEIDYTVVEEYVARMASIGLKGLDTKLNVSVEQPLGWAVQNHDNDSSLLMALNGWIDGFEQRNLNRILAKYVNKGNVFGTRKPKEGELSGFDGIIKKTAKNIGWDWRLLASVAYKESRFHIEGQSRKGAVGLMQLLPGTAARFGAADPIDPQQSVAAAATYLSYIEKLLVRRHEDLRLEHALVLASYNAGEGQILRCLQTLDSLHVSTSVWENVIQTIPSVEGFKGKETVAYVKEVLDLYEDIKRFLPSLQDRPGQ